MSLLMVFVEVYLEDEENIMLQILHVNEEGLAEVVSVP